jgi:hypothetical protein
MSYIDDVTLTYFMPYIAPDECASPIQCIDDAAPTHLTSYVTPNKQITSPTRLIDATLTHLTLYDITSDDPACLTSYVCWLIYLLS